MLFMCKHIIVLFKNTLLVHLRAVLLGVLNFVHFGTPALPEGVGTQEDICVSVQKIIS